MTLSIKVWNVKHGLAIYINTPDGKHITIDAGIGSHNEENDFYPLYHLNKNHNVEKIDYAIITHPHKDHIEEIKNLKALSPKVISKPNHITENDIGKIKEEDKEIFEEYFSLFQSHNAPVEDYENPKHPENNGGVSIKTFHPDKCSKDNLNNHSIVTIIEYAKSKILIPGDNEPSSWEELLEISDFKEAIKNIDVFVAPHHGRESSYHQPLFDHFKPKIVIISDGKATTTNASSKYSGIATGWSIFSRSDKNYKEKRFCLSTRQDGMIEVKVGFNNNEKPFLNIKKD
ncbi:MAG: MBL fold metallo-hydrolase [Nanoarchaeota archaeon]|nr:MBL fold metallo-hydrolase [Nanoarchaeota archaeon]